MGLTSLTPIILPADPTNAFEAATKQYVDSHSGGGYARTTASVTTASLAPLAAATGTVTLANSYRLLRITLTRPARVCLYSTTAKRDADTRPIGTVPTGNHGLMYEFVGSAALLTMDCSPMADGFDGKATPDGAIPYTITNLDSATGTVGVTLLWIRTE